MMDSMPLVSVVTATRNRLNWLSRTLHSIRSQSLTDLEAGAERLATTFAAVAHRAWPVNGSTVVVQLVMTDRLVTPMYASEPDPVALAERVRLGRTQGGSDWWL